MQRRLPSVQSPWRPLMWAAVALCLWIPPAYATLSGSAHDFSATGWAGGEICLPCHTPHNAEPGVDAPLWNHEISTASYTLYTSATLSATPEQPGPGGISRLCLSCHDGTVALDALGGGSGSGLMISAAFNLGTDLRDDHPISTPWDHSEALGMCTNCHNSHIPSMPPGGDTPFFSGKIECASCHDVHNNGPEVKLLRLPLAGSELCLHCHSK